MSVWGGESIYNAITSYLTSPPKDKKINKLAFTYNGDGTINTIQYYQDSDLLFTLTFAWSSGSAITITRS